MCQPTIFTNFPIPGACLINTSMLYTQLRKNLADPAWISMIESKTSFLPADKTTIRQRLWHIDNNVFTIPSCKMCATLVRWNVKDQKYRVYCSAKCTHSDPEVTKKREETCMVKFGFTTNLKNPDNKQKQKDTCLKKYGVDNFSKTSDFLVKFKQTSLERYGVDNPSKLTDVKEKINQTHLLKYGRKRSSQCHIPEITIDMKNDRDLMNYWFNDLKMPISEIAERFNINTSQLCVHFKNNLGIDISRHAVSSHERQISEFLTSIGVYHELSNRTLIKPKELDIWVPDYNIAIELDGLAWHTELRGKDKFYHRNKTEQCELQGVRLIHILDSEWKLKNEIVKSRIAGIFGKNIKIGARRCNVVQLAPSIAKKFFDDTHVQGACPHSICYGLMYKDTIVAAMSFGKSRFNKGYQWELIRYSSALHTNVAGGASKLISYFKKTHDPVSIVSYCDLRWNTGNLYLNLGFVSKSKSLPNYWYTRDYCSVESRMRYQKHKLPNLLPNFDNTLTEWENMCNHGYDRYWDCGNLIFTWTA